MKIFTKTRMVIGVLLIFAIGFFIFNAVHVKADAVPVHVVKYESVLIRNGQSLWNIANQYSSEIPNLSCDEYIQTIKQVNQLASDDITEGDFLLVPIYETC